MTRLAELEAEFCRLGMDILLPMRLSKEVDSEAVNRLYALVDEIAAEIGGADKVPRLFTGKLWFVFTQMLNEADHTRSPDDILTTAWGESHPQGFSRARLIVVTDGQRPFDQLFRGGEGRSVGSSRPWWAGEYGQNYGQRC